MNLHISKVRLGGLEVPVMVYYEAIPPLLRIDTIEIDQKKYEPNILVFHRLRRECMEDYHRTKPIYDACNKRKHLNDK